MRWLDALERRFGDWAIPQFPLFIALISGAVYLMGYAKPETLGRLQLDPAAVFAGEWWRIFTFLFVPAVQSPFWLILWLFVMYQFTQALEQAWGAFRFCFFYFFGAAVMVIASLWIVGAPLSNAPLYTTIFLAFATLYPELEVLLFFIIPVRVKYLAWITWILVGVTFLMGGIVTKVGILASLANYFLFFGPSLWESLRLRIEVYRNRRRFDR